MPPTGDPHLPRSSGTRTGERSVCISHADGAPAEGEHVPIRLQIERLEFDRAGLSLQYQQLELERAEVQLKRERLGLLRDRLALLTLVLGLPGALVVLAQTIL